MTSKRRASFIIGIVTGVMLSVFFIAPKSTNKTYVYVDIDKIISGVVQEVSQNNVEDTKAKIDNLKQRFEFALTDYQQAHNALIFSSPKPIKGALDKTDYFIEQILNHGKNKGEKQR